LTKRRGKAFVVREKKNVHSVSHTHILDFERESTAVADHNLKVRPAHQPADPE